MKSVARKGGFAKWFAIYIERSANSVYHGSDLPAFGPNHGIRRLGKVGQSRWLGRRPIV